MAFKSYVFIENQDGPVDGPLEDGSIEIFEIDAEVYLPYDTELNKPQGTRRINPVKIVFEKGPHSPLLMKTLCEGQTCPEIKINWQRIEPDGSEKVYFTTTLKNAKVVRFKEWSPLTKIPEQENIGHLEEISVVAEEYLWLYEPKGIEYNEVPLKI